MEKIKNSKGEVLPQPYLDLARMRSEQLIDSNWSIANLDDFKQNQMLYSAFCLCDTPEGLGFWLNVDENPEIPAASLAELEDWRKAKVIAELQPAEPDYKAMYYELLDKLEAMAAEGRKRGYLPNTENEKA